MARNTFVTYSCQHGQGDNEKGGGAAAHFLITIEIFRWFFLLHILSFYYIAIVLGEKRAKEKKIN